MSSEIIIGQKRNLYMYIYNELHNICIYIICIYIYTHVFIYACTYIYIFNFQSSIFEPLYRNKTRLFLEALHTNMLNTHVGLYSQQPKGIF